MSFFFSIVLPRLIALYSSHLNRRRYAQNDETLYVAPEDSRTDYVWFSSGIYVAIANLHILNSRSLRWLISITEY